MKIYLVLHHEIMGAHDNLWADEMVFFTARSFEKAIRLIKNSHVSKWSWWEIQVHDLDSSDWPVSLGLFGLRGGKLRKSPYEKCVEIFKREGFHSDA